MGLDMYLHAEKYVGNWSFSPQAEKDEYKRLLKATKITEKDLKHLDNGHSIEVKVQVAYWRKANAIHKWFVEKCQGGVDDCRSAYVERERLTELVDLCKQVLNTMETVPGEIHNGTTIYSDGRMVEHIEQGNVIAQPKLAEKLLPTQSGFFFGATDYDEYYLDDLRNTVKQIEAVLKNPKFEGWSFRYHSSW